MQDPPRSFDLVGLVALGDHREPPQALPVTWGDRQERYGVGHPFQWAAHGDLTHLRLAATIGSITEVQGDSRFGSRPDLGQQNQLTPPDRH